MNEYIWRLSLLIILPLVGGLIAFSSEKLARKISIFTALATLLVSLCCSLYALPDAGASFSLPWVNALGANYSLQLSGSNYLMVLLTALLFVFIFIYKQPKEIDRSDRYFGLMLLAMSGLMGVFLAHDLLLFYFFWELALIPVYILASMWGGEKRIKVAFKFFVYTFLGSLLMLGSILYLYIQSPEKNFSFDSLFVVAQQLSSTEQIACFLTFFIAFAIKMPIFPLHSWQPDAYQQMLTPVTIVMSALMAKMGLFAAQKWMIPYFPQGFEATQTCLILLSLISIVYGSLVAFVQTNIKKLIAYSSLAHIGLMALALFANGKGSQDAVMLQMFMHGINITAIWLVLWSIEDIYQSQEIKDMGRLANIVPVLSIFLIIATLANLGLPLTSGFVGEFLLFNSVFQSTHQWHILAMIIAGTGIILGAVYMLNMVQKVAFVQNNEKPAVSLSKTEWLVLVVISAIILFLGVYPQAVLQWVQF